MLHVVELVWFVLLHVLIGIMLHVVVLVKFLVLLVMVVVVLQAKFVLLVMIVFLGCGLFSPLVVILVLLLVLVFLETVALHKQRLVWYNMVQVHIFMHVVKKESHLVLGLKVAVVLLTPPVSMTYLLPVFMLAVRRA